MHTLRKNALLRYAASVTRIGSDPNDSEELRLHKAIGVSAIVFGGFPTWITWTALFFHYNEADVGWIGVGWVILIVICLVAFGIMRRGFPFFRFITLLSFLAASFIIPLGLGGIANSGAFVVWGLVAPLFALITATPQSAVRWFVAYGVVIVASGILEEVLRVPNNLPVNVVTAFFVINILVMSGLTFSALYIFTRQRDEAFRLLRAEQAKSENLLLNILPADIAARLKRGEETIADHHESVSILFMDIVNFTPLSASVSPTAMVDLMSRMFSQFDQWVDEYGVQKIETIGDSYMVAAGLSQPRADHARAVTCLALDVRTYFEQGIFLGDQRLNCRIGINSGPVTAGVIERKKIAYHVWGDTVNTASRMESHGVPGQIQISQATHDLIKDEFICEPRGTIPVKGKGEMHVWLVRGMRAGASKRGRHEP